MERKLWQHEWPLPHHAPLRSIPHHCSIAPERRSIPSLVLKVPFCLVSSGNHSLKKRVRVKQKDSEELTKEIVIETFYAASIDVSIPCRDL